MSDDPTKRLSNSDKKLDQILSIVQDLQPQLDAVNARLDHFGERQKELEAKVDARLHETRPIWEQVLSRLTGIDERQQQMEQRLESMDRRIRWIYDEFKDLKARFRTVFNDVGKLLNDRDDFEERILKLETERSR